MNKKKISSIILFCGIGFLIVGFSLFFYGEFLKKVHYSIVVLPDTQNYSSGNIGILKSQTQWIVDNIEKEKISFVVQEGDLVNYFDNEKQWQNVKSAFNLLENKVPYGLSLGNHDMSNQRESELFKKYFSENKKEGDYPVGTGYNSYHLLSLGESKYILLNLVFCPTDDVLSWANGILNQYQDRKVIIVTHGYLGAGGDRNISVPADKKGGCIGNKENTQYIFDKIVYQNKNVFLILSGHTHAEVMRIDKNIFDQNVFQLLADYQSRPNGGEGWLRILEFYPITKEIKVKTYSPYLNKYETDGNSQFILNY